MSRILVQGTAQDFIINADLKPNRDKSGNILFTDEKEGLANHTWGVNGVVLYVEDQYNNQKFTKVWANPDDIIRVAKKISELRQEIINTIIDAPDDDLPF